MLGAVELRQFITTQQLRYSRQATHDDTCTQNEIDYHTDDAHVTTPCCSMIDHASANCKHAASARPASGTQANHASTGSTHRHVSTLHDIECTRKPKQSRACSCLCPQRHGRPRSRPATFRPHARGHIATCHSAVGDADRAENCQRRNERRSDEAHDLKLARRHHIKQ